MASQSPGGFKGKKAKRSARDKRLGKYAPASASAPNATRQHALPHEDRPVIASAVAGLRRARICGHAAETSRCRDTWTRGRLDFLILSTGRKPCP